MKVSLLGELRVEEAGVELPLPASRKARALLAFLFATARPHRRERLCEMFWDLPDDPRASLRWALTKLRHVVDRPDRTRIVADRERVEIDSSDVGVDLWLIHDALRMSAPIPVDNLEDMARKLDDVPFDGLDDAGSDLFEMWLRSERQDIEQLRVAVLRRLATHPEIDTLAGAKWLRLWREADPEGAEAHAISDAARNTEDPQQPIRRGVSRNPRQSEGLKTQRIGFCGARDGTKIAYATVGSGLPLLKAANWLTHLEFDWQSPIWGRSFQIGAGSGAYLIPPRQVDLAPSINKGWELGLKYQGDRKSVV